MCAVALPVSAWAIHRPALVSISASRSQYPAMLIKRIASLSSQRHLARLGNRFRRSGIPIMALGRLCEYSLEGRADHDASQISQTGTSAIA